jgi:poly-gamma-glutamate capsule biosynthesis protein CapA/YwtB (metallophosphatase superfamily)
VCARFAAKIANPAQRYLVNALSFFKTKHPSQTESLRLFLCGDVMTGRGIDQVLPHPVTPVLHESHIRDARRYVDSAEEANGPIKRPVTFDYIWGETLPELTRAKIDLKIVNLETAITTADKHWLGKGIHYRMHPRNVPCLSAPGINACALANNHVLDWGHAGLAETLRTLDAARIAHAGAGKNLQEAGAPAVLNVASKPRVLVYSIGSTSSGIPGDWRATNVSAGVSLVDDFSAATAARVAERMRQFQESGDLLVASIHWGGNWGYEIPYEQIAFAHRLIEEGVSVVHGHSSHHVKAIEVFKGKLILYGCGDFITDYEGISSYKHFRRDLALMYLVELDSQNGQLKSARLVPMRMRRFRLERTSAADAIWLAKLLTKTGAPFGTRVDSAEDDSLRLGWQ